MILTAVESCEIIVMKLQPTLLLNASLCVHSLTFITEAFHPVATAS